MTENNKRATTSKRKIISWLGTLLIIAGVTLALFPFLQNYYIRYQETSRVEEKINQEPVKEEETEDAPLILPDEETVKPEPQELPENLIPREGVLEIPAIDLKVTVGYGVELSDLKDSPGFYPQSGYPEEGNVSIAGHRTTYGAWFRHLDELKEGDEIRLYYGDKIYYYFVEEVFPTHSRDWGVIEPTPTAALTLTTCHPPGWATQRLIVRAHLSDVVSL
ncbi:MAG: sortase [Candidatus Syntrophonatronum acetioxidans]|uniref:Sortase n=1 Tax=Candidatus Syntrophonatronum acetioxidans TaxID=1795816 RepID=A0A424YEZ3_9FIRM|nr:MAG: sortase [Candidatus Syntrophonatronum acetioxidans]